MQSNVETTNSYRKRLLYFDFIVIALININLIPKKISFLGLEYTDINKFAIYIIFLITIIFCFIEFLFYSVHDIIIKKNEEILEHKIDILKNLKHSVNETEVENKIEEYIIDEASTFYKLSKVMEKINFLYELILPCIVTIYSLFILIYKICKWQYICFLN
jgi:hypothetical protein